MCLDSSDEEKESAEPLMKLIDTHSKHASASKPEKPGRADDIDSANSIRKELENLEISNPVKKSDEESLIASEPPSLTPVTTHSIFPGAAMSKPSTAKGGHRHDSSLWRDVSSASGRHLLSYGERARKAQVGLGGFDCEVFLLAASPKD